MDNLPKSKLKNTEQRQQEVLKVQKKISFKRKKTNAKAIAAFNKGQKR